MFDFKKCCDLDIRVKGYSRSPEPTRIDPGPITSYYCYIATMSLSRTVSEINGDFSRKSPNFPHLSVFYAAAEGVTHGI